MSDARDFKQIALDLLQRAIEDIYCGSAHYVILRVLEEDGDTLYSLCAGEPALKQQAVEGLREMLKETEENARHHAGASSMQ